MLQHREIPVTILRLFYVRDTTRSLRGWRLKPVDICSSMTDKMAESTTRSFRATSETLVFISMKHHVPYLWTLLSSSPRLEIRKKTFDSKSAYIDSMFECTCTIIVSYPCMQHTTHQQATLDMRNPKSQSPRSKLLPQLSGLSMQRPYLGAR
jgi:hypothetical protein